MMFDSNDRQLLPKEIASITGIPEDKPRAQYNALVKQGIKAFINARREVVTFSSWVQLAGVKQVVISPGGSRLEAPANDELKLDFSGLDKMVG